MKDPAFRITFVVLVVIAIVLFFGDYSRRHFGNSRLSEKVIPFVAPTGQSMLAQSNADNAPKKLPTRLRFEDYIYRLWVQQTGLAAAHVNAVQTHTKNNYMRNPPAADVFNEEICTLLKRKIKESLHRMEDLSIKSSYNGEVTLQDSEEILNKVVDVHTRLLEVGERTASAERRLGLQLFAENLSKAFYGFEPDFFQQNVSRIVDDVISQFHASLEIWPSLVEICYLQKDKHDLPQTKVKNKKVKAGIHSRADFRRLPDRAMVGVN